MPESSFRTRQRTQTLYMLLLRHLSVVSEIRVQIAKVHCSGKIYNFRTTVALVGWPEMSDFQFVNFNYSLQVFLYACRSVY